MRSLVLMLVAAAIGGAQPGTLEELKRDFAQPPDDARILMRWWWFGPAVTQPELEREMRAMKAAGIGGFEVQPVYPLALDDPAHSLRNLPYLSPEFLDALRFTGAKAKELGLRMDLTLTSGWPYGGPHISVAQSAGRLRVVRTTPPVPGTSVAEPRLGEGETLLGRDPVKDGSVLFF